MFQRFVEIGRVVMCTSGSDYGKLAVIVEVIDHGRVLVEGEELKRQVKNFKQVTLTPLVLNIPRGIKTKSLVEQINKQELTTKWQQTAWFKKMDQKEKRRGLCDFGRFKVMLARKKKSTIVGKKYAKLLKK